MQNDYRHIAAEAAAWAGPFTRTVSIVLPVYNGRALLANTLAALAGQTYPRELTQVVLADDGSSDHPEELLHQVPAPIATAVVRQEHNGYRVGLIRGKGILAAAGEVIVALDSDMLPVPGFLAAHMRWFHLTHPLATVGMRRFLTANSASDVYPVERRLRELAHCHFHPAPWNVFHGCNVAFRKSDALAIGLYDPAFDGVYGYEDIEFGYRLFHHGVRLVNEPEALALHQESDLMPKAVRSAQSADNYPLACRKMPGYAEFRARFAAANYIPWW